MFSRSEWSRNFGSGDRSLGRFTDTINKDESHRAAFYSAIYAHATVLGKGDETNSSRAIEGIYKTSSDSNGLLNTGRRLYNALDAMQPHLQAIVDFMEPLWEAGLHVFDRTGQPVKFEAELANDFMAEGLMRDYLLPPTMRPALEAIAEGLEGVLQELPAWRHGRGALAKWNAGIDSARAVKQDPELRDYARAILQASKLARGYIFYKITAREREEGNALSYSGPTAWAARSVEAALYKEFFSRIDSQEDPKSLKLVGDLARNFRFNKHYLGTQYGFLATTFESVKRAGTLFLQVERQLAEQKNLASAVKGTSGLDSLPLAHETARTYLHAPPGYFVRYYQSLETGEVSLLHISNSMATSIVAQSDSEVISLTEILGDGAVPDNHFAWSFSTDGVLRSTFHTNVLPLMAEDLNMGAKEFEQATQTLEERTLRQISCLGQVWTTFPGLYSACLRYGTGLLIVDGGTNFSFSVKLEDKEALTKALLGPFSGDTLVRFTVKERESAQTYTVELVQKPAVTTTPPPEVRKNIAVELSLSRDFIAMYCPQFRDLFRILVPFGVTLESGKGSHEKLMREGFMTVVSKNQRDGTLLLNETVIRQILHRLRIPEADFVRTTRGDSKSTL